MAWVRRAVETTPVAMPIVSAISAMVVTSLSSALWQLPRITSSVTPRTPISVLMPVVIAAAVPAESAVWALVL